MRDGGWYVSLMVMRRWLKRLGLGAASTAWPWPIEASDTYVVSYPRSGNTWVRSLLARLREPDAELTRGRLDQAVPDPYRDPQALVSAPRPRLIKSHSSTNPGFPRVIYVARDGRDALVSYYHMEKQLGRNPPPFDSFVRRELAREDGFGNWPGHVAHWWSVPMAEDLLRVRFEDLWRDPHHEVARIARFARLPATPEAVAEAVGRTTPAAHMRSFSDAFPQEASLGFSGGLGRGPGQWRSWFDARLVESFWERCGAAMTALGYARD